MPLHYTSLDQLTVPYRHVVLSPHLDDAALALGGTLAALAAAGQPVLVVNICCGSPPPADDHSPFARAMHARWGLPPDQAVALRLQEDRAALEILGADSYQLDLLDAIYRMPKAYASEEALFGPVAPDDTLTALLWPSLQALATRYPAAIFYGPLGVGHHVDHQGIHIAAIRLASQGLSMAFYEDFPYVAASGALDTRFAEIGGAQQFMPVVTAIDGTLSRKTAAVDAYTSQISTLFGDSATMALAIAAYAAGLHPDTGTYGERIWVRR